MRGLLLLYCVVLVTVVGATPLPRMSAAVRLARGSKRVGRGGRRGFQVVVTERMKEALVGELGYLVEEVEDMEPQIAAVVIENGLQRPRAGMPHLWRKRAHGRKDGAVMGPVLRNFGRHFYAVLIAPFQASKAIFEACQRVPVIAMAIIGSSLLLACSSGIWDPKRGSDQSYPSAYHGRGEETQSTLSLESTDGSSSLFTVGNGEDLIDDLPDGDEDDIGELELEWNNINTVNSGTRGESWLDLQVIIIPTLNHLTNELLQVGKVGGIVSQQ